MIRKLLEMRIQRIERTRVRRNCCIIEGESDESNLMVKNEPLRQTTDFEDFPFKISNINQLPSKEGKSVDSQTFLFDGTEWDIQTYTRGLKIDESEEWISFVVIRIGAHAPKQNVLFTFGIRDSGGQVKHTTERIWKRYDVDLGPIKLLPLSQACKIENNFLQEGAIDIVCRMSVERSGREAYDIPFYAPGYSIGRILEVSELDPDECFKQIELEAAELICQEDNTLELITDKMHSISDDEDSQTPSSPTDKQDIGYALIPRTVSLLNQIGELEAKQAAKSQACIKIRTWKLPSYIRIVTSFGCNVVSRKFEFDGKTYRMRFYPLGRSEYERRPGILVSLERSRSPAQGRGVTCELSLDDIGNFSEKHYMEEHEDVLGPIKLISRLTICWVVGVNFTVHCKMQL